MSNAPIKPGGKFFRYRNGLGGFFWKGMSTRTDLGAQPADRPRLVINGRYLGGHIVARPPINPTPVASVPARTGIDVGVTAAWHPAFLAEHHSYAGLRLWFSGRPQSLAPTFTGGLVGFMDTDWDQEYREVANYYHAFSFAPSLERFANFIYVGDFEALRRVYRIDATAGSLGVVEYDYLAPADEIVVAYPGFVTTALHYHEGKLYFALADPNGALNGFIYAWDGYKSILEYNLTVPGTQGVSMKSYRNTLVVTVRGLGSILVRSATGTWSTATVGGFDSSPQLNSMAELGSKLYIAGGADKMYSWDGTTLAVARTITVGTTPTRLNCCVTFNGRLYYLWAEQVGANDYWPWLGVFDPDTVHASYKWKDDYKSFGYTDGTVASADVHNVAGLHPYINKATPTAIAVYRQRLMVAIEHTVSGTGAIRTELSTHVTENNPYSVWHIVHTNGFTQPPTGPMYIPNYNSGIRIHNLKVM